MAMIAVTHPNIWRKRHNLAAWIIQILASLAYLILTIIGITRLDINGWPWTTYRMQANLVMALAIIVITNSFTVTEIILLAKKSLEPVTMLILVSAKAAALGVYMVFVVVACVVMPTINSVFIDIPITFVLLATVVAQVVVSTKVFNRSMQQQKQEHGADAKSLPTVEEEQLKDDTSLPKYKF